MDYSFSTDQRFPKSLVKNPLKYLQCKMIIMITVIIRVIIRIIIRNIIRIITTTITESKKVQL